MLTVVCCSSSVTVTRPFPSYASVSSCAEWDPVAWGGPTHFWADAIVSSQHAIGVATDEVQAWGGGPLR